MLIVIRNGPALFELGQTHVEHQFDKFVPAALFAGTQTSSRGESEVLFHPVHPAGVSDRPNSVTKVGIPTGTGVQCIKALICM